MRNRAAAFEAEVDRVLDGLLDVPDTVRTDSPEAIGNFAAEQARARRPKLSDDVCQAIGNYVAYQWR